MKKLIPIIVILCTFLLLAGCSVVPVKPTEETSNILADTTKVPMYTYDGDIDPQIFAKWEPVSYNVNKDGYYHIVMFNPAKDTDIPQVEIVVYRDMVMVYGFFRDGVRYLYAFDLHNNHYEQVEPKRLW